MVMFDFLYHAKKLREVGFTEAQVDAQIELAKDQIEFTNARAELIKKQSDDIIMFDFFKHAKNLQKAGFTEAQVDAIIEFARIQVEFSESLLVELKEKITHLNLLKHAKALQKAF